MKRTHLLLFLFLGLLVGKDSQYVFDLEITGNEQIESSQLKNKIRLNSRGFFSKTEFNQKKLHLDEVTLKNYYQTMGFIDVKVSATHEVFQNTDVNVNFEINEGKQYFISEINHDGIKLFQGHELDEIIHLSEGDIYNPAKLRRNLKRLKYEYLQKGKLNISIVEDIILEKNTVAIKLLISEGATYFIRKINIKGLVDVKQKYITRELLFSKDMVYNVKIINRTREQIFESGLFSSVEIHPQIVDDEKLDISIKLREYKSREVGAEIGFNQLPSTEGDLPISAINGKLQWRVGQLFNTASAIRFNGEIGVSYGSGQSFIRQYYEAYYTSPWLASIRLPVNFKIYYEEIEQRENLTRLGIQTSFNYFDSNKSRLLGNLNTEFISSDEVVEAEERSINFLFSKYNILDHISPKNGYYVSITPSIHGTILGGNFHYLKIDTEFKYYFSFFDKIVFANRLKVGMLSEFSSYMLEGSEIPSFDKFHLGGQTSLRGWSSPDDFESSEFFGGTERYLFNSEIRFPLYSRLGMELFYDIGSFGKDSNSIEYDWDAGYGLTINTGLGPARVDAAYKQAVGKPTILFSLLYMF
ncbi:MAG: BamA/TamA family outer membrane protein [Candidatus Marinimicrobia bacterium]|nr:BamA/TamA family outer membrane protein [Candidatus Neomarinimicrobiota bacterium]